MLGKFTKPFSVDFGKSVISFAFLSALIFALNINVFSQVPEIGARPDRGIINGAAYSVSSIDAVNLQSGNVTVKIPLAGLPAIAGGKLSYTVNAYYNSKLWDVGRKEYDYYPNPGCPQQYSVDIPQVSDMGGWRIGGMYKLVFRNAKEDFDYVVPSQPCDANESSYMAGQFVKILLQTPDGAEHELKTIDSLSTYGGQKDFLLGYYQSSSANDLPVTSSKRLYSFDGSYLWAVINPSSDSIAWAAYMKDGMQVIQYRDGVQKIKDANGNSIKIFTDTNNVTHYQDELTEREIKISHDTVNDIYHTYVHYQTVGGVWKYIDLVWGETTVQGKLFGVKFSCPTGEGDTQLSGYEPLGDTLGVLREIVFPVTEQSVNPLKYTFSYNSDDTVTATDYDVRFSCTTVTSTYERTASVGNGELSEITTPSGAVINYEYVKDGTHKIGTFGDGALELPRNVITEKSITHDSITDT